MSGAPAEIDIVANDEASDVFQEVSGNFAAMTNEVSEGSEQTSTAVTKTTQSFSQSAMQMNTLALSGAMLYSSINSIENSQVTLDRANLVVEKSANSVTLAQQAYNQAVAKYGENSLKATDAANKLSLAEQTHEVAVERDNVAHRNYNDTLIMSSLTIIPSVIGVIGTLNSLHEAGTLASMASTVANGAYTASLYAQWIAAELVTAATGALDAVMDANPIILVVLAVVALAAIFYVAYEKCKPFRDVINEIGSVIGGAVLSAFHALTSAGNDLWGGLQWAYNNILLPVANFFKEIFVADLNVAMIPIKAFESAIGAVANAVKPLSDLIGGLGSALSHLCFAHAAPAAEEFNKQVTQSISLSDQLAHKTNTLGSSLQGLAGNVSVKGGGGTSNVTIGAPNITIGSVTGSASLKQTRDAVSKGICDAMYKKGIINKVM